MAASKRIIRNHVTFVALDLLHEDAGKVQEVGAGLHGLAAARLIGVGALLVPAGCEVLPVGGDVWQSRRGAVHAVAVDAGVIAVDCCRAPRPAGPAAMAGGVFAGSRIAAGAYFSALVRRVGTVVRIGPEGDIALA